MTANHRDTPDRILLMNDLITINDEVTDNASIVRDHKLLRSAVARPYQVVFGVEQFPTLIEKAAATLHSLAARHLFIDGNKRTAARATALFLEANGIEPTWTDSEMKAFVLQVARGEVELEAIAPWIEAHSRPKSDH